MLAKVEEMPQLDKTAQKKTVDSSFKVVSLFSGCGGMDYGLLGDFTFLNQNYAKLPFDIIWANDLNKKACASYKYNIGDHIHQGDIWQLLETLPINQDIDLVIGGFPCQDISINGKGLGVNGARSGLYRAMVDVVSRLKPKIFVAENVKGLLMKNNEESLKTIIRDFKALGYNVTYKLYNSADYGVPQTRERVFIVGTLPGVSKFNPPEKSLTQDTWITAKMAIDDLKKTPENKIKNHIWSKAKKSSEQGDRKLKADRAGYTIRAECHGNIQYHYSLKRRISMREAARIQSFPDNFEFQSMLRETERQIGNAVPPVLAWHVGNSILEVLKG